MKYKVKLTFKYCDTVDVEADSKDEAIEKAMPLSQEVYECWYDAEVTEDSEG